MTRPAVEVADILRAQGNDFIDRHRDRIRFQQLKVMSAIVRCRTAALGGHIDTCPQCGGDRAISYNSCRNRHCPKCQAQARQRWIAATRAGTCWRPLTSMSCSRCRMSCTRLSCENQIELYNLLFRAVAETLVEVARNPKHLGADIGFFGILHTWGQNLLFHPHIHCVIPGGGLAPDRTRWIHSRRIILLTCEGARKSLPWQVRCWPEAGFPQEEFEFCRTVQHLAEPKCFAAFLRTLFRQNWVVYAKPPFGGPEQVLRYLGRYTHRVAISNHRLLPFDGNNVTFRWRDYAHGNIQRDDDGFRRRVHSPIPAPRAPEGFCPHPALRLHGQLPTIRIHGTLPSVVGNGAGRSVERKLLRPTSTRLCPICHAPMTVIERLTAAQIAWRFVSKCFSDTS